MIKANGLEIAAVLRSGTVTPMTLNERTETTQEDKV
jgi:hypothetical protein